MKKEMEIGDIVKHINGGRGKVLKIYKKSARVQLLNKHNDPEETIFDDERTVNKLYLKIIKSVTH